MLSLNGVPKEGRYLSFREEEPGGTSHPDALVMWLTSPAAGRPVVAWNGHDFDFPVITEQLQAHYPERVAAWDDCYQFDAYWWAVEDDGGHVALLGRTNTLEDVTTALEWEATTTGIDRETVAGQSADVTPAEVVVCDELAIGLQHELYAHQATAVGLLANDENMFITTVTSSGKTLIYQLQMARNYLADGVSTALCLHPTKALTAHQEQALNDTFRQKLDLDVTVGVYDGDTKSERKRRLRENANTILTNPAGLNVYLPRHNKDRGWHRFYNNLELVVIDKIHEYSGIMGTHVA